MQHDHLPARGAPSRYRPEFVTQAEKLCRLGATDVDLADFFGVSRQTVHRWRRGNPEFCDAVKKGKLVADANVAEALYRRAVGYSHPAVRISAASDGRHVAIPYVRKYPPDTTAAIFWLKNRRPAEWSDKRAREMVSAPAPAKVVVATSG